MTPAVNAPKSSSADRWLIPLALVSLYLIWGSTYLGIAVAVRPGGFASFQLNTVRFVLAGLMLFLFLRMRGAALPNAVQIRNASIVGVLLVIGGNGLTTLSLHLGAPSGISATVIATTTLWAGLWSTLWGNRPRALEWIGMGVGLAGVAVLTLEGTFQSNPAILIQFIAPMLWALGSIYSRHAAMPEGMMASAVEMIAGGMVAFPISLLSGEQWNMPSLEAWGAFAYLVVFGSLVGFNAYGFLLTKVRPAVATSYAYINPIVALGLGLWLLNEKIDAKTFIALPIILIGVGLIAVAQQKNTRALKEQSV
jgi:drug/metabolite transporter (DMT)-like permease